MKDQVEEEIINVEGEASDSIFTKAGVEIDFNRIIFYQILETNRLFSMGSDKVYIAVDILENLLTPYRDDEYEKAIKQIEKDVVQYINKEKAKSLHLFMMSDKKNIRHHQAYFKHRALVMLAKRAGIIPIDKAMFLQK